MDKKTFTPNSILKSLPKGFNGVSIPKKTHDVWICADTTAISVDDASKAIKNLCKDLGVSIIETRTSDTAVEWHLQDKAFNKQMVAEARECAKAMQSFFSKYGTAYRYCDAACEQVAKMMHCLHNEQLDYEEKDQDQLEKLKHMEHHTHTSFMQRKEIH